MSTYTIKSLSVIRDFFDGASELLSFGSSDKERKPVYVHISSPQEDNQHIQAYFITAFNQLNEEIDTADLERLRDALYSLNSADYSIESIEDETFKQAILTLEQDTIANNKYTEKQLEQSQ